MRLENPSFSGASGVEPWQVRPSVPWIFNLVRKSKRIYKKRGCSGRDWDGLFELANDLLLVFSQLLPPSDPYRVRSTLSGLSQAGVPGEQYLLKAGIE